jgi:hypothetical protein
LRLRKYTIASAITVRSMITPTTTPIMIGVIDVFAVGTDGDDFAGLVGDDEEGGLVEVPEEDGAVVADDELTVWDDVAEEVDEGRGTRAGLLNEAAKRLADGQPPLLHGLTFWQQP